MERLEVALLGAHVEAERRLAVGARRAPSACRGRRPGTAVSISWPMFSRADVPAGERRHLPDRFRGEHADDRVDVLAPERLDVPLQQVLLLRGGQVGLDGLLGEAAVGELGVGALQRGVDRGGAWCRAPRRPRRPTSGARRAGSARRADGPAGAGARRRRRAGSSRARRRRRRRRGPARARGSRGRARGRRRPSGRGCRARPGAAGGAGSRGWSGRRWWRSGRARSAPRSGPGSRPTPSRRAGTSPGRGPPPRAREPLIR